jgi:hypothetical protein
MSGVRLPDALDFGPWILFAVFKGSFRFGLEEFYRLHLDAL